MSVQRRPKTGKDKNGKVTWVVRYRDPAGKEHSETYATSRDAKIADAARAQEIARGAWRDPALMKITVGTIYRKWMHSVPRRQSTMDLYEHTRRTALPPIADYKAARLTSKDVADWYTQLTTCRKWLSPDDTGVSPATARDALRRLRSAYRWAIDEGIVTRSPVTIPKTATTDAVEPADIPTIEEINRVINLVRTGGAEYTEVKRKGQKPRTYRMQPHPVAADMMTTAMLTGMRVNELCGLIVADLDLGAGVIHLTRQMDVRTRERGPLKTKAGRRDIPIADELAPILRAHTHDKAPTDWVFRGGRGHSMNSSRLSVYVKRAAVAAGAERVHFHALRHFFASSLITAGRPIQEVSKVMGHSKTSLTLDTYTHILDRSGSGMRDAISAAIGCGISAGSRHLRAVE